LRSEHLSFQLLVRLISPIGVGELDYHYLNDGLFSIGSRL